MDAISLGTAGLQGWRVKVADALARPVAQHSRLSQDQVRAVLGSAFFGLSLVYVVGTMRRLAARR